MSFYLSYSTEAHEITALDQHGHSSHTETFLNNETRLTHITVSGGYSISIRFASLICFSFVNSASR